MKLDYQILIDQQFPQDLWERLEQAQTRVFAQFMTFEGDAAGTAFADRLIKAKSKGLDVNVIIDNFTDFRISDTFYFNKKVAFERIETQSMMDRMSQSGITLVRTNPLGFLHSRCLLRNHKKIVVIDDSIYLGGINISDHNFSWHDFMVRFDDPPFLPEIITDLRQTLETQKSVPWQTESVVTNKYIDEKVCELLETAEEEVIISGPYIFDLYLLQRLSLVKKGVKIKILTNQDSNLIFYDLNKNYVCNELAKLNAEILFYNRFSHAKFLIVDREKVLLGSYNFDIESCLIHDEIEVLVEDQEFANEFYQELYQNQGNILARPTAEEKSPTKAKLVVSFIAAHTVHYFFHLYQAIFKTLPGLNKNFWLTVASYLIVCLAAITLGVLLKNDLLEFIGYFLLACTFLPLPADTYVLHISPLFSPLFIGVIGGIINAIAVIAERKFVEQSLKEGWGARARIFFQESSLSRYFMKFPFLILFISALSFIPFETFRFLAITNQYNIAKYSLATALGRGTRYFALAAFGGFFALNGWLGWLSIIIVISLVAYYVGLFLQLRVNLNRER